MVHFLPLKPEPFLLIDTIQVFLETLLCGKVCVLPGLRKIRKVKIILSENNWFQGTIHYELFFDRTAADDSRHLP